MLRKLMAVIAALAILACSTFAFAAEARPDTRAQEEQRIVNSQVAQINEQLEEILNSPTCTAAQKNYAIEKAERIIQSLTVEPLTVRSGGRTVYVPFYEQNNNYYCGPATVQQTLGAWGADVPDQETVAAALKTSSGVGTENENIRKYLNSALSPYGAVFETWWNSSSKNLKNVVLDTIDLAEPIVLHIKSVTSAGRDSYNDTSKWPYRTSGHYLNISGYDSDGDLIQLTDPNITRTTEGKSDSRYSGGKYYMDYSVLNNYADRIIY